MRRYRIHAEKYSQSRVHLPLLHVTQAGSSIHKMACISLSIHYFSHGRSIGLIPGSINLVIMLTVGDVGFCSDRVKELIDLGADVNLMSTYDWSSIGGHKRVPPLKLAEKLLAKLEQDEDAESWVIDHMKDVIEHLKRAGATTEGAALRMCDSDDESADRSSRDRSTQ